MEKDIAEVVVRNIVHSNINKYCVKNKIEHPIPLLYRIEIVKTEGSSHPMRGSGRYRLTIQQVDNLLSVLNCILMDYHLQYPDAIRYHRVIRSKIKLDYVFSETFPAENCDIKLSDWVEYIGSLIEKYSIKEQESKKPSTLFYHSDMLNNDQVAEDLLVRIVTIDNVVDHIFDVLIDNDILPLFRAHAFGEHGSPIVAVDNAWCEAFAKFISEQSTNGVTYKYYKDNSVFFANANRGGYPYNISINAMLNEVFPEVIAKAFVECKFHVKEQ